MSSPLLKDRVLHQMSRTGLDPSSRNPHPSNLRIVTPKVHANQSKFFYRMNRYLYEREEVEIHQVRKLHLLWAKTRTT